MLVLMAAIGLAGPPDREVALVGGASGAASSVQRTDDGRFVVWAAGSAAWVLDIDRWQASSVADCAVRSVGIASVGSDSEAFVGCDDGTLRGYAVTADGFSAYVDGAGAALAPDLGTAAISGLWYQDASGLWFALEGDSGILYVHSYDPVGGAVDGVAGTPIQCPYDGFVDAERSLDVVYVAHGGDDVSRYTLGSSSAIANTAQFGIGIDDLGASPSGGVYAVDGNGTLAEHTTTGQYVVVTTGLDAPSAVAADLVEGWLVVARDGSADAWTLDGSVLTSVDPAQTFPITTDVVDLVAGDGYAFGGTSDGSLTVFTSRPWISDLVVSPTAVTAGTEVTLSFGSDTAGAYGVFLGGDRDGSGTLLAAGEAVVGDHAVVVSVGEDWPEGENTVWVLVTDVDLDIGHAATAVAVDNPPDALDLDDSALGFADEGLYLRFDGVTDEDLSGYVVYVTTVPFTARDWTDGGGPAYEGPDALTTPIEVEAAPEEAVEVYIGPLTNYVTYYVSARAVDAAGQEGPMSPVLSEMPRPTFGASELAGDGGGISCASGAGRGGGIGAALASAWLVWRGRRRPGRLGRSAAAVGLLGIVVALPGSAGAEDQERKGPFGPKDLTPARGSLEIRVGSVDFSDSNIDLVYGEGGSRSVHLEVGPQFLRFLEVDLGVGFTQATGTTVDEEGLSSAEFTNLTVLPITAGLSGRLHLADDQLLVPYGGLGIGAILWRESWDAGFGVKERVTGTKQGTYLAAGVDLMLDPFAPARASLLEAQSGINDSYIVFEWRKHVNEVPSGLSFSGQSLLIGLKLDY